MTTPQTSIFEEHAHGAELAWRDECVAQKRAIDLWVAANPSRTRARSHPFRVSAPSQSWIARTARAIGRWL